MNKGGFAPFIFREEKLVDLIYIKHFWLSYFQFGTTDIGLASSVYLLVYK